MTKSSGWGPIQAEAEAFPLMWYGRGFWDGFIAGRDWTPPFLDGIQMGLDGTHPVKAYGLGVADGFRLGREAKSKGTDKRPSVDSVRILFEQRVLFEDL